MSSFIYNFKSSFNFSLDAIKKDYVDIITSKQSFSIISALIYGVVDYFILGNQAM